ncbi:MAG: UvrD-helicase domain-containing protein [Clostridia bacterium]|nr:UvrD-helicase domain-containing protein [Clostridia bacterium]
MYLADLHIHSKYSMATSREGDLPHLEQMAAQKGLGLIGTGDFTHPTWRRELKEQLLQDQDGLYTLRPELRLRDPGLPELPPARFVITGEISCIYKRAGKTRKVHNLIILPDLAAAEALSLRLERIGNIHSDGRPILGLDSQDLLDLTLNTCPEAMFIPAHIWTPHFSVFGAFSGFATLEECFGDLAGEIHGVETGLSSDPPMNWRVSALDGLTLISNSDAHSPAKLGREANLIGGTPSYRGLKTAIETGVGFLGTLEFFPEEGKYHLDGHRNCGICLTPEESNRLGGRCPVCGKKLTIGVEHRVWELSDRPEGELPQGTKPFEHLAPLEEVVAGSQGLPVAGKETGRICRRLRTELGQEFYILREASTEDIARVAGPCVAEGIRRLRAGQVKKTPGFDGEYGKIQLLTDEERREMQGRLTLFALPENQEQDAPERSKGKKAKKQGVEQETTGDRPRNLATENPEQEAAIQASDRAVAVIAGPGSGKTRTLTARVVYLLKEEGVPPEQITAVTFTNQAAGELKARIAQALPEFPGLEKLRIGTFHAICLSFLEKKPLLGEGECRELLGKLLRERGDGRSPGRILRAISAVKNGASPEGAGVEQDLVDQYGRHLQGLGVRDLDDVLQEGLHLTAKAHPNFSYLLVDEYQDVNPLQEKLIRTWNQGGKQLFVIGDPDQSIYGFRGADAQCFQRLQEDWEGLRTIVLKRNYRSTLEILSAAQKVIEKNPGGPRELQALCASGTKVRFVEGESRLSEGIFLAKEIAGMVGGVDMLDTGGGGKQEGTRAFSDIAVLARTHQRLEELEACLLQAGIPCEIRGRGSYLEAEEVKRALGYFQSLLEGKQPRFTPGIEGAEEEYRALLSRECPERILGRWRTQVEDSKALGALTRAAVACSSMEEFLLALTLGEEQDLKQRAEKPLVSGAVQLMTCHGAKGLEFPVVFVSGLTEGCFPSVQGESGDAQEERRLLFVAMTRAREELILTGARPLSGFVQELPREVLRERARKERELPAARQLKLF